MQSSSAQLVCLDMPPYTHMGEEKEQEDPLAQSYARRVAAAQQQPDFVLWSLFNFVFLNYFCCLGLAALVFSIKSRDRKVAGDPDGAASYGKTAKCLNIITAVIVSILVIIVIGVVIYLAVAFRRVALGSDGFTKPWN